jgi:hypothetical protein
VTRLHGCLSCSFMCYGLTAILIAKSSGWLADHGPGWVQGLHGCMLCSCLCYNLTVILVAKSSGCLADHARECTTRLHGCMLCSCMCYTLTVSGLLIIPTSACKASC